MKKLILFLVLCMFLSSCGLFKKVFKQRTLDVVKTSVEVKSDSIGTTIDKSVVVVRERVDTTVTIPTKTIVEDKSFNMDSLINGITSIKNDLFVVKLIYDPLTKILRTTATLREQTIPIHLDRTTTTNKDITTNSSVSKESKTEDYSKKKTLEVKKEPAKMGIWLIAIIVVVGIISFLIYKKLK